MLFDNNNADDFDDGQSTKQQYRASQYCLSLPSILSITFSTRPQPRKCCVREKERMERRKRVRERKCLILMETLAKFSAIENPNNAVHVSSNGKQTCSHTQYDLSFQKKKVSCRQNLPHDSHCCFQTKICSVAQQHSENVVSLNSIRNIFLKQ